MKIGIIGSGAYAIALTSILENKNLDITMWTKFAKEYEELTTKHTNLTYLDYKLDNNINFTMDLEKLIKENNTLILAIPAKFIHETFKDIKTNLTNHKILIATKGIENTTYQVISTYLKNSFQVQEIACISGPTFAKDIIKKEAIGLTLASDNEKTISYFQEILNTNYLTLHTTKDIVGVELCGVIKNIMAIFSGILEGMQLTSSTKAKFMVDACLEIQNIIEKLGGQKETFYTYAGLGDLLLTATSTESRNYTFGLLIGLDKDFKTYSKTTTVEGLESLESMKKILDKNKIKSKIIDILYGIVYLSKPKEVILEFLKNSF